MKRIYKYGTGEEVPEGAVYMGTVTETKLVSDAGTKVGDCFLVWHYFLVEVTE